ncbi:DinB family protein [Alicyclobacillus sp. ALC3]|uniref:DinB family protein n=1 Tax=Alicyclobacillus sp. ALC3 TaxID=2796143 RepID=UPI002378BB69|nr:DinB family protein [Alicyclobacillus sp. ALC3]WDL97195.1 DinB family protein [Alicyclobacillus sp. ALC3]
MNIVEEQYKWVRQTREVLFDYCESLDPKDYVKQVAVFGFGSVRNIHVHVADCYRFWLLGFAEGQTVEESPVHAYRTVADVRVLFAEADQVVENFIGRYGDVMHEVITGHVGQDSDETSLPALWLATHTMTHEFHHKGQIVSLTRHLGYAPPDTDLVIS